MRSPAWEISLTPKALQEVGPRAGLRLADISSEAGAPTFQVLDRAGKVPGSQLWIEQGRRRERDLLVGEIVRNEDDNSRVILLHQHALALLHEDGLVNITALDDVYGIDELEPRRIVVDRLRSINRTLKGVGEEIDGTTQFLLKVGGLAAAITGLLKIAGVI
jgi:hypothetical protein